MGLADLIQLGSAVIAPGDIVGAVRDVYRRVQFAMRVEEETNYILKRRERINRYIEMSTTADDTIETRSVIAKSMEEAVVDANQYILSPDSIQTASTKMGKFEKILNRITIALSQEQAQRLQEEMRLKQSDNVLDEVLRQVCIINKSLEGIKTSLRILRIVGQCYNDKEAKILLKSQYAVLETESQMIESEDFESIADENLRCRVEHKGNEIRRTDDSFKVLFSVITALFVAKRQKWYHRRLSTKYISVRKDLKTEPYAKVHSFRCPISGGCPDIQHCQHCKSKYDEDDNDSKMEKLDRSNQERNRSVRFWESADSTAQLDPFNDAAKIDSFSFASLTLWMFSGQKIEGNNISRMALERVPWPLRWIVLQKGELSLHQAFSYLHSIYNETLDPYLYSSDSQFPMMTTRKQELSEGDVQYMHEPIVKSIIHGVNTEDPEAMVQMGLLIEHVYKTNNGEDDSKRLPLMLAYKYFTLAGVCGETEGFFRYASRFARSLERNKEGQWRAEDDIRNVCDYLLHAASGGCRKSIYVMEMMTSNPNWPDKVIYNFTKIFSEAERNSEEKIYYNEKRTLRAIYEMGYSLRRGLYELPQLLDLAETFLEYAASREYLDAKLELALLKRQNAENSGERNQAVNVVKNLCNTVPHPTGYVARYWYGFWSWQFSTMSGEDEKQRVVAKKIAKYYLASAAMFRTDAKTKKIECMGNLNAMALYLRIVEREQNRDDVCLEDALSSKWNVGENSLKFPFLRLVKALRTLDRLKKEFEENRFSRRRLQNAIMEYEKTIKMMTEPYDLYKKEHPEIAFDPRLLCYAAIEMMEFEDLLWEKKIRKCENMKKDAIEEAEKRLKQILDFKNEKGYQQSRMDYIYEDQPFFRRAELRLNKISKRHT